MADAMKLVPVEPTREMIEAAYEAHYGKRRARRSGGAVGISMAVDGADYDGLMAFRRMWKGALAEAASPPAREEAPAEVMDGALETWLNARDLMPRGSWDWPSIVAMLDHHEAALRNRTSEPAGDAVAWRARMRPDGEWMVLDAEYVPGRSADDAVEVQPLFTHPAPATADKLRVAVEALERTRDAFSEIVTGDIHHSGPNIDTDVMREGDVSSTWVGDLGRIAKSARKAADAAIAALNEQPQ